MFIGILISIMVGYLGVGLFLYFAQPRIVYWPTDTAVERPEAQSLKFDEVWFKNSDGVELNARYLPCAGAKFTVLFCHGNGGNISYYTDRAVMYHSLGANCMLFDYGGYGKSKGRPTEEGTYKDVAAAYKWLIETKKIQPEDILVHGWSLGGPIAANLASTSPIKGLILESTLTSVPDVGKKLFPIFPVNIFCRYKYDTAKFLENVKCPVLIMHSPEDDVVPYSMGLKLFETAGHPKKFVEISGPHNQRAFEINCEPAISDWLKTL